MKLGRALEVVRVYRKRLGGGRMHCADPMCTVCAMLTLEEELREERGRLEALGAPHSKSRGTCKCGRLLIDGLCGVCNG